MTVALSVYLLVGVALAFLLYKYGEIPDLEAAYGRERVRAIAAVMVTIFWLPMLLSGALDVSIKKEGGH